MCAGTAQATAWPPWGRATPEFTLYAVRTSRLLSRKRAFLAMNIEVGTLRHVERGKQKGATRIRLDGKLQSFAQFVMDTAVAGLGWGDIIHLSFITNVGAARRIA